MAEVLLVIVEGPNAGREFDVSGGVIVGRDDSAGVVIDDPEASRKHASLASEGTGLKVEDLGSTNGTFVNEERLSGPRTVAAGDRVRIGTTIFEVRAVTQATQVRSAIPDEPEVSQATRVGGTAIPEPTAPAPEPSAPAPEPTAPAPEPTAPAPQPVATGAPGGGQSPGFPPLGESVGAPPPAAPPPGQPPVAYGQAAPVPGGYPVDFEVDYPSAGISRWRPFFQSILAIPHFFALAFVGLGAYFVFIYVWFAILFTRRYPDGAFRFIEGVLRWAQRVNVFTYLMTERYPPFTTQDDPSYPVRLRVRYPEAGISRWRPFLQGILAIPHLIVLWFVAIGALFAFIYAWFAILFTRNYPTGAFEFIAGSMRWGARVNAYILLMTEDYPPFALN